MKFNTNQEMVAGIKTYNGENAVEGDLCFAWLNMLFTTNLADTYYESAQKQLEHFMDLTQQMIDTYGVDFTAKAVHYARNVLGRRSASMLGAAMLNEYKFDGKRHFYNTLFHRPDDIAECFAAIDMIDGKRSHALVRGAGDYISSLGDYQMGKYKMNGKKYNMYDLINITHAKSEVVTRYKHNNLKVPNTWEVRLSAGEDKEEVFSDLIMSHKLGYLALIRNLRNIVQSCFNNKTPIDLLYELQDQLIDTYKIRKSLIYPYQIFEAWKMLDLEFNNNYGHNYWYSCENFNTYSTRVKDVLEGSLRLAFLSACGNMPTFDGKTLFIIDVSGSMDSKISDHSQVSLKEAGACYAESLIEAQGDTVDVIVFGTTAQKVIFDNTEEYSPFSRIQWMTNIDVGYSTEIEEAFKLIDQPYDRIILISDMQCNQMTGWGYWSDNKNVNVAGINVPSCFTSYYGRFGKCPIYCFDLSNYNRQPGFCADEIYQISAFNDEIVKMLSETEKSGSFKTLIDNYSY